MKVRSSTRSSLEETPEMENVSNLNIGEMTSTSINLQAVNYNLDIGVLLFTLLAGSLDFQQEGKGKPRNNLTLFISPTFK